MGERGWHLVFNWRAGDFDRYRVFILSNKKWSEDTRTDTNKWMGVMVEHYGCSLLMDFYLPGEMGDHQDEG